MTILIGENSFALKSKKKNKINVQDARPSRKPTCK